MPFRRRENTGYCKRKRQVALYRDLALEEAMDLSYDHVMTIMTGGIALTM
jgi:hypothetical protein